MRTRLSASSGKFGPGRIMHPGYRVAVHLCRDPTGRLPDEVRIRTMAREDDSGFGILGFVLEGLDGLLKLLSLQQVERSVVYRRWSSRSITIRSHASSG